MDDSDRAPATGDDVRCKSFRSGESTHIYMPVWRARGLTITQKNELELAAECDLEGMLYHRNLGPGLGMFPFLLPAAREATAQNHLRLLIPDTV